MKLYKNEVQYTTYIFIVSRKSPTFTANFIKKYANTSITAYSINVNLQAQNALWDIQMLLSKQCLNQS